MQSPRGNPGTAGGQSTPPVSRSLFRAPTHTTPSASHHLRAIAVIPPRLPSPAAPPQLHSPAPLHTVRRSSGAEEEQLVLGLSSARSKKLKTHHSAGIAGNEIPPHSPHAARAHATLLKIDPTASPLVAPSFKSSPSLGPTSQTPDGRTSNQSFANRQWEPSSAVGGAGGVPPSAAAPNRARSASTAFDGPSHISAEDEDGAVTDEDIDDGRYKPLLPTVPQTGGLQITSETLMELLRGSVFGNPNAAYAHLYDRVEIVDCRFPYEYAGGHIKGAINLYRENQVAAHFLARPPPSMEVGQRTCIVFHCEFSQQRGPHLFHRLRKHDRDIHGVKEQWNRLYYPEVYILEKGYREFFSIYGPGFNSLANTPTPGRTTPGLSGRQTPAMDAVTLAAAAVGITIGTGGPQIELSSSGASASIVRTISSPSVTVRGLSMNPRLSGFQSIATGYGSTSGSLMASPAATATPSSLGSAVVWPNTNSRLGAASPSMADLEQNTGTADHSGPSSHSNSFSEADERRPTFEALFEDSYGGVGGYVRMRDGRYKHDCTQHMKDHDMEKKLTRSQSTGSLQTMLAEMRCAAAEGNNSSQNGSSQASSALPSASPSPALISRTLSARGSEIMLALGASSIDHLHANLRIARRRSVSAFHRNHGEHPELGSPLTSPRSLLGMGPLVRSASGMDSPNFQPHTPSYRATMTPSPSVAMLQSFSLGSPTSRTAHTPVYSNLSSLNVSAASPVLPAASIPSSMTAVCSLDAALMAAAQQQRPVAAAANVAHSPPFLGNTTLPPSPPHLTQSRSDLTRQLSDRSRSGGNWGVQLTFSSNTTTSASLIAAATGSVGAIGHGGVVPMQCDSSPSPTSPSSENGPTLPPSTSTSRSRTPASALETHPEADEDM